jgi:hypothetical protein
VQAGHDVMLSGVSCWPVHSCLLCWVNAFNAVHPGCWVIRWFMHCCQSTCCLNYGFPATLLLVPHCVFCLRVLLCCSGCGFWVLSAMLLCGSPAVVNCT